MKLVRPHLSVGFFPAVLKKSQTKKIHSNCFYSYIEIVKHYYNYTEIQAFSQYFLSIIDSEKFFFQFEAFVCS